MNSVVLLPSPVGSAADVQAPGTGGRRRISFRISSVMTILNVNIQYTSHRDVSQRHHIILFI